MATTAFGSGSELEAGGLQSSPSAPQSPSSYEYYAPRSDSQRSNLAKIAALTAGPVALSEVDAGGNASFSFSLMEAISPPVGSAVRSGGADGSLIPDSKGVESTLKRAYETSDHLTMVMKHATSLRFALRASINIAEDVSNRHSELLRQSGELSAAAERLQAEEETLSRHAAEIGLPLQHYDAVDRIGVLVGVLFKDNGSTVVRGLAKLKVDSDDFASVLDEIDEAAEYFGVNRGAKETVEAERSRRHSQTSETTAQPQSGSVEYYRRSTALREAALDLIREAVATRISHTAKDVAAALQIPKVAIAADKLEASLVYTRFHGISSRSNRLLNIVHKRADRSEAYTDVLKLCRNTYCASRESLLKYSVRTHMDKLKERHGLVGMTRLASVFLIRICTVETSMYLDFFGDSDLRPKRGATATRPAAAAQKKDGLPAAAKSSIGQASAQQAAAAANLASQVALEDPAFHDIEFQNLLGTLCASLHRTVRRGLVSVHDLDTLCQVVSVLREERALANSSPTTLAAAKAISGVIVDAQERLIFCANSAVNREVVKFKPSPDDLDYPNKLVRLLQPPSKEATPAAKSEEKEEEGDDAVKAQLRIYESWFPPMRSVLRVLSKIFRVVEPRVFEDIALQAVQACTRSLKTGSAHIVAQSGVMHADLFLVKHLLILREQLSPFDIQLRSVERQLDFSDAGKAVTRFLANRNRRLFSISTENALLTLLREGVHVQESSVDSKRDLDDALRSACNDLIDHRATEILGRVAPLLEQCKNATASGVEIATAPFLRREHVEEVFGEAVQGLDGTTNNLLTQMGLYLENTATQAILLRPVVRKVTRALDEARKFVAANVDGDNGWDADSRSAVMATVAKMESIVKSKLSSSGKQSSQQK